MLPRPCRRGSDVTSVSRLCAVRIERVGASDELIMMPVAEVEVEHEEHARSPKGIGVRRGRGGPPGQDAGDGKPEQTLDELSDLLSAVDLALSTAVSSYRPRIRPFCDLDAVARCNATYEGLPPERRRRFGEMPEPVAQALSTFSAPSQSPDHATGATSSSTAICCAVTSATRQPTQLVRLAAKRWGSSKAKTRPRAKAAC